LLEGCPGLLPVFDRLTIKGKLPVVWEIGDFNRDLYLSLVALKDWSSFMIRRENDFNLVALFLPFHARVSIWLSS